MTVTEPRRIDSHAHVFTQGLPLVADRRYAPGYDARPETYLTLLDAHAVSCGLLVQPSFLGTDNTFLLSSLARAPERLRGVAVVAAATPRAALAELHAGGVVGLRLNLWGAPALPDVRQPEWQRLLRSVREFDWHVELHAPGPAVARLLEALLPCGVSLVVDHFGRPDARLGAACPGFRSLLRAAKTGRVWVKLSAPYRLGAADEEDGGPMDGVQEAEPMAQGARYAVPLLETFGAGRLLWGSDWPWTRHETGRDYGATLRWLDAWAPRSADREAILCRTPAELFKFPAGRDAGSTKGGTGPHGGRP